MKIKQTTSERNGIQQASFLSFPSRSGVKRNASILLTGLIFLSYTNILKAQPAATAKQGVSALGNLISKPLPQGTKETLSKEKYRQALKASENTISFQENKGQWEPNVLLQGHTNIGDMVVKKNELYFLSLKEKQDASAPVMKAKTFDAHGWGITLEGYNEDFTISKSNAFETRYNYFIGADAVHYASDVSAYGEVTLQNIYEGIDLRLYSQKEKQIEFDWVVNAGADYRKIKMHFKGQEGLRMDEHGNLEVKLRFDVVKFDIPEAFQVIGGVKVPVKMAFAVHGGDAYFTAAGKVDGRFPLIIDPSLKWGAWMDGDDSNFDEYLFAVDEDSSGNVYCGGAIGVQLTRTYLGSAIYGYDSTYNDGTVGADGSHRDGIIYEIKNDGTALLRVTYFGSTSPDAIYGLSLSPDKSRIFACGYCSGNIPAAGTPFDGSRDGVDGFVAVFSSDLKTLVYSSYIGGAGTGTNKPNLQGGDQTDRMVSIRALNNTDFVIGGRVNGALPAAYIKNAYDGTYGGSGGLDMYIAKFTAFNNLTFGTYVGGSADDELNDLNVFSDGSVAFSGYTSSPASGAGSFPALVNAAGSATSANQDGVVGVIPSGGGTFSMLSRIGGSGADIFNGLSFGPADTIYLTGYSGSSNFPLGTGASASNRFRFTSIGSNDGIVGKIPRAGKTTAADPWIATYFGGTGDDRGNTIRSYASGTAVMIFGETGSQPGGSNGFPVKNLNTGGNTFYDSLYNGGTWDMFFFALGTDLNTEFFCTYVGGSDNDYLGETGVEAGSNHFVVEGDSLILLGTTSHSATLNPTVIGPVSGPGTVFDFTHGNTTSSRDVHIIFKWRIGAIFTYDFGDAPRYYGAARHGIKPFIRLGSLVDAEDFYPVSPGTKANADDNTGADDEDAIAGAQVMIQDTATKYSVTIPLVNATGNTATLMAWIDFNRDGIFNNNEVDTVRVPSGATSATLRWSGFFSSFNPGIIDTTYLRIRFTTDPLFNVQFPSDSANALDGEVEDYMVIRYHCVNLTNATVNHVNPPNCKPATGSITISNTNLLHNAGYTVYYVKNSVLPAVGPLNIVTQNNGDIIIPNLGIGTYSNIQVFHPTDSLCGSIISSPVVITLSPPPPVNISPNGSTTFCQGGSVILNVSGGVSYLWSTGETTSSVSVSTSGTFTVTGTSIDECTATSAPVTVKVNANLQASVSPLSLCEGQSGNVCATSTGSSLTYKWNSGISTSCLTVSVPGTYSVVVTDGNGCTGTSSVIVNGSNSPALKVVKSGSTTFCTGDSITLTASGAASYAWNNGSTAASITAKTEGLYTVTGSNALNCQISVLVYVTVYQSPVVTITPGGNTTFCQGGSVALNANGAGTYLWSNGKNGLSINASSSGTYSVVGTDGNGCKAGASKAVTVNPLPDVTLGNLGTACSNAGPFDLNQGSPAGGTYSGAGVSSNAFDPIAAGGVGSYSITYSYTNGNGCSNSAISSIIVGTIPGNPGAISGPVTAICHNTSKSYSIASVNDTASYIWTAPTGASIASGQGTNTVSVSFGSSFTSGALSVTANNACGSTPSSSVVISSVPATPVAIFGNANPCKKGYNLYWVNPVAGAASYNWNVPPGSSIIGGQGTDTIAVNTGKKNGNITVAAVNACGNSGAAISLSVDVSCREAASTLESSGSTGLLMTAYPNPTRDVLNVLFISDNESDYMLRMFDVTGRMVINQIKKSEIGDNVIQLSLHVAKGLYIVSLSSGDLSKQLKIVVQ